MIQFQNKRLFFAAFLLFFSVLLTGCASKEEKAIRQTISSELDHLVSPDATQINTYLSFQLLFPDAQQDDSSDLDPSITEIQNSIKTFLTKFRKFHTTTNLPLQMLSFTIWIRMPLQKTTQLLP